MPSTTAKRYRMRCRDCDRDPARGSGRFTLKKHPDKYVRPVKCPACKGTNLYHAEQEKRNWNTRNLCRCAGYPFRHRAGSLRFCDQNPQHALGFPPTDEEIEQHQTIIETPRTQWEAPVSKPETEEIPF